MTETKKAKIPKGMKECFPGVPLLEVVSITVTHCANSIQLHGRILVHDDEGLVRIFDVKPKDSLAIDGPSPNKSLPLLNRNRVIFPANHSELYVYFDLKNGDGDAEFINCWYSLDLDHFNILMFKDIHETQVSVRVSYYVHWTAVEANVWATLDRRSIPGDLNAKLKVVAGYEMYQHVIEDVRYEKCGFTIFEKEVSHDDKDDRMPLNGCVLALPIYSDLTIDISLRSCLDDKHLWSETFAFDIQQFRIGHVFDRVVENPWCCIKLFGIAHNYHGSNIDNAKRTKRLYCPKWLFEVYDEDKVDEDEEDEDEEEDEEDRKRKMSQPQEQINVKESP